MAISRQFGSNQSGTSAVEFALIAPVLLVILMGVLAYGFYFGAVNSVQQLAADAARASVAGLSDTERSTIARDHVKNAAASFAMLDPNLATVAARPSPADPAIFEVSVSYDASKMPFWSFAGLLPMPSKTIRRSAAIQRGGY